MEFLGDTDDDLKKSQWDPGGYILALKELAKATEDLCSGSLTSLSNPISIEELRREEEQNSQPYFREQLEEVLNLMIFNTQILFKMF